MRLPVIGLVLGLCLYTWSCTSHVVFGGVPGEGGNGDVNGDGDRDISDAVYLLRWIFQGGPQPVEITCPDDQADRVAELEVQLDASREENAVCVEQLAIANREIADLLQELETLRTRGGGCC